MLDFWAVSGMIRLSFRDRFDILLEKRPSGVAELRYIMVYGKSELIKVFWRDMLLKMVTSANKTNYSKVNNENIHFMLVPSLSCPAECKYCFGPHHGPIMSAEMMNSNSN